MTDQSTNEQTDKPIMVNVGVKVTPEIKAKLIELAASDRRKLSEFLRNKLEDITKECNAA